MHVLTLIDSHVFLVHCLTQCWTKVVLVLALVLALVLVLKVLVLMLLSVSVVLSRCYQCRCCSVGVAVSMVLPVSVLVSVLMVVFRWGNRGALGFAACLTSYGAYCAVDNYHSVRAVQQRVRKHYDQFHQL